MEKNRYKWVIYFIGITIALTIVVQVYWNYREYQINKQHLISKVQLSLDNAVEDYYANITRSGFITINSNDSLNPSGRHDTIVVQTPMNKGFRGFRRMIDSTLMNIAQQDSGKIIFLGDYRGRNRDFHIQNGVERNMDSLISKVMVSISTDTLDLDKLNDYLIPEFDRNKISITYAMQFHYHNRISRDSLVRRSMEFNLTDFPEDHLDVRAKSSFLPYRSSLKLLFTNETAYVLQASFISILLSFLLSLMIIGSILYLLKTIFRQKQLAEVKNDLISNITHEFKTPIATISTALEALKSFNALEDKEKSETYIKMSREQVEKLNVMVEKLLETATLNSGELLLEKEEVHLGNMIGNVIERYKLISTNNSFKVNDSVGDLTLKLDVFHFENALGNIIDNAIKYGGPKIIFTLKEKDGSCVIEISDNGNGIHKSQKEKVFDQFYRIPTGNTHNVKGFGIGLYYTKKIIEKHGGTIDIIYDKNNNTLFQIILPHD